jgi:CRISPR-associated protein Cas2
MGEFSEYRFMWLLVMFDLPVHDKLARKRYAQFRKMLLKDGFTKLQYSVYLRHAMSKENAEAHAGRVASAVPADGHVRTLLVTEAQLRRMQIFWGKKRLRAQDPPEQLMLF